MIVYDVLVLIVKVIGMIIWKKKFIFLLCDNYIIGKVIEKYSFGIKV